MTIEQLIAADEHSPEQVVLRHEDHRLLHERFATLPEQYQTVSGCVLPIDCARKRTDTHFP
jgi:hypothetical protein